MERRLRLVMVATRQLKACQERDSVAKSHFPLVLAIAAAVFCSNELSRWKRVTVATDVRTYVRANTIGSGGERV